MVEFQYRSTLQALITTITNLRFSEAQLQELGRTPFWFLLESITNGSLHPLICRKSDPLIRDVIANYSSKRKGFIINNRILPFSPEDVKMIFGIKDGDVPIEDRKRQRQSCPFVRRRFGATTNLQLTKGLILEALNETISGTSKEDNEDVARLVTLLALVTVFVPCRALTISWRYAAMLEDMSKISTYNWSQHIFRMLITSLRTKQGNPEAVIGCIMAIPYWLCERTGMLEASNPEGFPRCVKWNLQELMRTLKTADLNNLDEEKILREPLLALTALERERLNERGRNQDEEGSFNVPENETTLGLDDQDDLDIVRLEEDNAYLYMVAERQQVSTSETERIDEVNLLQQEMDDAREALKQTQSVLEKEKKRKGEAEATAKTLQVTNDLLNKENEELKLELRQVKKDNLDMAKKIINLEKELSDSDRLLKEAIEEVTAYPTPEDHKYKKSSKKRIIEETAEDEAGGMHISIHITRDGMPKTGTRSMVKRIKCKERKETIDVSFKCGEGKRIEEKTDKKKGENTKGGKKKGKKTYC